jgi:hypothetical protein
MSGDRAKTGVFDEADGSSLVVDEAVSVVNGIRSTARWVASSFGAIPSLAVLSSIVRAPGSGGFDPLRLAFGVSLTAVGAVTGVLFFAWVIAPVPLEDDDVRKIDLRRVPSQQYASFDDLLRDIALEGKAAADLEHRVSQRLADAKDAEANALKYTLAANEAQLRAWKWSAVSRQARIAQRDRSKAAAAQTAAAVAMTSVAAADAELLVRRTQLHRRHRIRQDAYRLRAADVVGRRYLIARVGAVIAVALIAGGIVVLGISPKVQAHAGSAGKHQASGIVITGLRRALL